MVTFGPAVAASELELSAKRLDIRQPPRELFAKFLSRYENAFLLESASDHSKLAEYSFIGFEPSVLVEAKSGALEVIDTKSGSKERTKTADPLKELRRIVPPNSVSGLFRFIGGAVGYISYDAVRYWERIPGGDQALFPDLQFGIYRDGVVYDHVRGETYYYTLGENRLNEVLATAKRAEEGIGITASAPRLSMSRDEFEDGVLQMKEHISAGDIFQAVLSRRIDIDVKGELSAFYESLSRVNPSPYMYFLKFGDTKIIGSSPEMLARIGDRRVETYPIAGTRPVLADSEENARLAKELVEDPKEKAEHVMLVDLARNDVGKISKYGSVKVPEFMTVERFSHVQHMVSHVVGELQEGLDSYDALRAVFPAGTVSGAPKVRAMEIIEQLESSARGPYAGAVGYFSFNGNADFAITIRTLVSRGRTCSIQAGAGIVADSSPEKEWDETGAKARGLLKALELAEKA
ncbi:MAG: anthranilate synthase component I [Thaumarchaeota archaeon]|nr:anthranilate synthase component I [Nitrososphaerota archaeon]